MKMYYIIHGLTEWNKNGFAQGHRDIPLCDEGRAQARETAKVLADKHIDLCIASPLARARETAEIVLEGRDVPIIFDNRLVERNFGMYEGTPHTLQQPDEWRDRFWSIDEDMRYADIEPMSSVVKRLYEFLDEIKETYRDKSVLIASHGGLSAAVKYYIAGEPVSRNYRFDIIKNCEIIEGEI